MVQIENGEIVLLLDGRVFFFDEAGRYTSMSAKEARTKNFSNLFFDRNSRNFSYKYPHIFFVDDNSVSIPLKKDIISRAILRLVEGETYEDFERYIFYYKDLIAQKSYPIKDLKNMVVRRIGKKYMFFNNEEIIETLDQTEIVKSDVVNLLVDMYGSLQFNISQVSSFFFVEFPNGVLRTVAYSKLKNGDTVEDFRGYYKNSKIHKREPLKELDRFVTKIEQPRFFRMPGNTNVNTFDYIYVDVNLAVTWKYDKEEYYIKNKKKIDEMVLDKISKCFRFKKYEVATNMLKLSRLSLKNERRILEFVFELKEVS